jgi:hypothetical protein
MIWRLLRSHGLIPALLIIAALCYWKMHSGPPKAISVGFVSDRDVILWNTLAQVREATGEVHYGDRVEVLRLEGTSAQVRTGTGTIGWIRDSRQIMDSDLWDKSAALLEKVRQLPVQARGRTKTVSNVRVEPGRDGKRIFQFTRGTPVVVLERAVADAPQGVDENALEEKISTDGQKPKQEDWLLVMRTEDSSSPAAQKISTLGSSPGQVKPTTADAVSGGPMDAQTGPLGIVAPSGPVAGWVLARFIEFDLPDTVKDYASSADLHVVAWFELNRVPDGAGGEAPQYLVAGSRGGEGRDCDFTMLRVYTWGAKRKRYETAFIESDLCGRLPIQVSTGARGPEFEFPDGDANGAKRRYDMIQTEVRRMKSPDSSASRPQRRHP